MKKAYTLIELLIVLIFIGILASVVVTMIRQGGINPKVHSQQYRK